VQAVRRDGLAQPRVHDSGFDHRAAAAGIHPEHAIQSGERDQHRTGIGQRSAREAGAGAPRHERHAEDMEQPQQLDDFPAAARHHHGTGYRFVRR
jgi:hypothetical protein